MVEGQSTVEESRTIKIAIPSEVAEALGISEGDEVDVDYFNDHAELEAVYGDIHLIAITRK